MIINIQITIQKRFNFYNILGGLDESKTLQRANRTTGNRWI